MATEDRVEQVEESQTTGVGGGRAADGWGDGGLRLTRGLRQAGPGTAPARLSGRMAAGWPPSAGPAEECVLTEQTEQPDAAVRRPGAPAPHAAAAAPGRRRAARSTWSPSCSSSPRSSRARTSALLGGALYLTAPAQHRRGVLLRRGLHGPLQPVAVAVVVVIVRTARRLFSTGWAVALGPGPRRRRRQPDRPGLPRPRLPARRRRRLRLGVRPRRRGVAGLQRGRLRDRLRRHPRRAAGAPRHRVRRRARRAAGSGAGAAPARGQPAVTMEE